MGEGGRSVLVGFGRTNRAVAAALVRRGLDVVATDDRPTAAVRAAAAELGVELVTGPGEDALARLLAGAAELVPAPGLPDRHVAFAAAADAGVPVRSELDLAARWDDRPRIAVTGTDGKTTVTELAAEVLRSSAVAAVVCGNNDVPLVEAIDDPTPEVFVVEASSFRLLHSQRFAPRSAAWLNLAPDHLDNHASLAEYEAAKARIWRWQGEGDVAVGNADDPVVAAHLATAPAGRRWSFSTSEDAGVDWQPRAGHLDGPAAGGFERFVGIEELPRRFPHDIANALAAVAVAAPVGATAAGAATALRAFTGLAHRLALVGEAGGVRWYDSSKATTPHAALNDVGAVGSAILIAGGRNKGLDLSVLAEAAPAVRAVVAIGEAAGDVAAAFAGIRPVVEAASMAEAVDTAARVARPGDAVVLAPGCASFDWYGSYGERGDDFARLVDQRLRAAP
jgi:UDP-N-acetylmuramoylalanine--D-glutamate ligase